jgi:hypothetical protein
MGKRGKEEMPKETGEEKSIKKGRGREGMNERKKRGRGARRSSIIVVRPVIRPLAA